ncbi:hypothetical protein CEXT_415011 [Caerostris extrusa]|uniref:Uncharacterized protein n=1 Tax=Caerostris extrusa TaxID=172846 RepID=A0AAV4PET6_CAEEX|nr:hypothetical protein CEXT_415011 [Caerostris extrusa]
MTTHLTNPNCCGENNGKQVFPEVDQRQSQLSYKGFFLQNQKNTTPLKPEKHDHALDKPKLLRRKQVFPEVDQRHTAPILNSGLESTDPKS